MSCVELMWFLKGARSIGIVALLLWILYGGNPGSRARLQQVFLIPGNCKRRSDDTISMDRADGQLIYGRINISSIPQCPSVMLSTVESPSVRQRSFSTIIFEASLCEG